MLTGSRITQHLRDSNIHVHHYHHHHHHQYNHQLSFGFGLGFRFCCATKRVGQTTVSVPDRRFNTSSSSSSVDFGVPLVFGLQPKSPSGPIPLPSGCFSLQEDDRQHPTERFSSVAGGIVALGKFDALHIGHRELAIHAAKVGVPFLLSFVGMAEVLGWEPSEFQVEFSKVRSLTPRQFVEKLSKELGVRGVVAGKNYRFGYRAVGDASDLVKLCKEYGLGAYIVNPVMDKSQDSGDIDPSGSKERGQVSSTRVRYALAKGDMKYVTELLGRQHRLMLMVNDQERFTREGSRVSVPKSCLLNLPPKDGHYQNCSLIIGDGNFAACKVVIDTTHIHLELDDLATCIYITSQDFRCLSIDFGESTD
ncbi:hypothetical protein RJ639_009228 [Escallonia herrerae]|uniref:FAD synthase n=1 Tax=Escallonia herrerae TaxID=1293975 RepID=A0AA88VRS1_9ASTE|nr:hypothetical protein RJ639_009228 [Escallonia herrerae]